MWRQVLDQERLLWRYCTSEDVIPDPDGCWNESGVGPVTPVVETLHASGMRVPQCQDQGIQALTGVMTGQSMFTTR